MLFADGGTPDLTGGRGPDFLYGDGGINKLEGGDHNDFLFGDAGDDELIGDAGADLLVGGGGDDVLSGGTGDDTFVYTSITDGNDVITGFVIADDTVDMDVLFDALGGGVATTDRAGKVEIATVNVGGDSLVDDSVLTIDGVAGFSITFSPRTR